MELPAQPAFPAGMAGSAWEPMRHADPGRRVTVVVNDATRPAVAHALLEPVADLLEGRVRIIVATGTHEDVPGTMKDHLLGGLFPGACWTCNTRGGGERVRLGRTSSGTEVGVHPWLVEADTVIIAGSVEPHYFAGFTGGRKAVLPGCAAFESVEANHSLACLEGSAPAVLEGNPVHADMAEAAEMLERLVPVVMAGAVVRGNRGLHIAVGSLAEAFASCVGSARDHLCVGMAHPVERIVLKPGGGLETNLYQSMKAVYNFEAAVAEGGAVLLDSDCPGGLGAAHMDEVLRASMEPGALEGTGRRYFLGWHSVSRLARIRRRASIALRSGLEPELVRSMGFEPVRDAVEWAGGRAVVIPDAGSTAPVLPGPGVPGSDGA